eukprot:2011149-Pleurochrysis_carterae.AAC.1
MPDEPAVAGAERYRQHLLSSPDLLAEARGQLAGKRLGCWCAHREPCRCRCLAAVANCSAEELAVLTIHNH